MSEKLQNFYQDAIQLSGLDIETLDANLHGLVESFRVIPTNVDSDTLVLKLCRVLENFDVSEFRLSLECLERIMQVSERYPYPMFRLIYFCANLVNERSGFYVSSRQFPCLTDLIHNIDKSEQTIERIEVLRTQVYDQLSSEAGVKMPPISERLLQLTFIFSAYELLEDEDHEVYNHMIRIARQMFQGMSFQQVMRLCQSITDFVEPGDLFRLILLQSIERQLNHYLGSDLMIRLLQMQERSKGISENWNYLLNYFIEALRIKKSEFYRLVFFHTKKHDVIPDNLTVLSTEKMVSFDIVKHQVQIKEDGSGKWNIKEDKGKLEITHTVGTELKKYEVKSADLLSIGQMDFLFRSDIHECAILPLIDDGLFVSQIDLRYGGNHILKDISAVVRRGEMMAVVGPSGCGKSTFLTMLSGLLEKSNGSIIFGGKSMNSLEDFSEISTYIPQDDILFRELTVHESVESSLRLKVQASESEIESRVRETIDVLGLERTEFLKIGNEGEKGISGGQRKRVNIGTTIVADMKPILLFDEPTSGLDPATDVEIMQLLRQLSRKGHIVICVTHNLSAESMAYFDKLMVLDKNGKLQFLGKEKRARYFFNIRSTHLLFQKMKEEQQLDYASKFLKTIEFEDISRESKLMSERYDQVKPDCMDDKSGDSDALPNAFSNFCNFYKRELRRKSRDLIFLSMCAIQPLLIGLFISWNFAGPMPNAIFSILAATLWIGAISGVREINTELPQLKRDYLYGTSLVGYLGSKVLSCFCFSFFQVLVMAHLIFIWDGYWEEPFNMCYGASLGMLLLLNLFGVSLGLFLSSAIRSALAAVGLLPVLLIPLLIMGGALIRHNQTDGFQWTVMKLNPLRISFESMLYTSDSVLRPSLEPRKSRDVKALDPQLKLLADYNEQKLLFEMDPQAYRERFVEEDLNDLFADLLSDDKEKPAEEELKPPKPSPELTEPGLLEHRQDLWLDGHTLLEVDHHEPVWSSEHYLVKAPKAFSQEISVQGATGMFIERDGDSWSIYRPIDYLFYPFLEFVGLWIAMYFCLKYRLAGKS